MQSFLNQNICPIVGFLQNIFKKTRETRDIFFCSICNILNKCIYKINLKHFVEEDQNEFITDTYLAYLYAIIFQLIMNASIDNISKIDEHYLTNPLCPIVWYDKNKEQEDADPNFFTKLFFLMLDFHKILIIPALERARTWEITIKRTRKTN